ncbi:MAG: AmmeMemoRadiSam system protein B [Victivallaceae bacterium]
MKKLNLLYDLILLAVLCPSTVFAAEKQVFESPLAGSWYPSSRAALSQMIREDMALVKEQKLQNVIALIQPHAGYRYSGKIAAYGLKEIANKDIRRVIIFGPSHSQPMTNCLSILQATHILTILGEVELDSEFIAKIRKFSFCKSIPQAHVSEHSVDIQIPMLQTALKNFKLVPIVTGRLDEQTIKDIAAGISPLLDDKTLVIASSDFTHYGSYFNYQPFPVNFQTEENLKKLDYGAIEKILSINRNEFSAYLQKTEVTICGQEPIRVLLELLPPNSKGYLLKYDTSGRMEGDYAHSVSYASFAFTGAWKTVSPTAKPADSTAAAELSAADKKALLQLARKTIENAVAEKPPIEPEKSGIIISPAMKRNMGVFVTLKKKGQLRGCIGEILPRRPLYQAIAGEAINSAMNDWRFQSVKTSELNDIDIEISVLTPPVKIASYKDIVIGRDGIIMSKNGRSAVFLPQVAAEQGWDLPETLSHLAEKAGLEENAWQHGAVFQTFQAVVFGEKEKHGKNVE